jgi:hypothetical protein
MIYFLQAANGLIKIGHTTNLVQRIKTLSAMNAGRLVLIGCHQGGPNRERLIHSFFRRSHGEWFFPEYRLLKYVKRHGKPKNKLPKLPIIPNFTQKIKF